MPEAASSEIGVAYEQRGIESRIKLSGRITIDSSPKLRALLFRKLGAPNCQVMIVDFCEVVYLDSSGLAVLLELLRAAKQLGKKFQLSGLKDRPRYLLESTRLLRLFDEAGNTMPTPSPV